MNNKYNIGFFGKKKVKNNIKYCNWKNYNK